MKGNRFLFLCWTALWVVLTIYLAIPLVRPIPPELDRHALDFRMRYNEAQCVRKGKDPYLMWNGTLPLGEYKAWDFSHALDADKAKIIHAYPPWEYVWMMPLTFFQQDIAERIFWGMSWLGILFLCGSAFILGRRQMNGACWAGFASMTSVLLVNCAIDECLGWQNYGILIAAAVLAAILCHRSGNEVWSGVFWSFTLVKPQLGMIFFVPLIIQRKWSAISTAAVITITGTLIAAFLCGRSPVDMILAITEYSKGQFRETGIVPRSLYLSMVKQCGDTCLMLCSAAIGLGLCAFLSLMLRSCKEPFEWILPAVFFSTVWTASRSHDQCVYAVMFLGLSLSACERTNPKLILINMLLIVLIALRGIDSTLPLHVNAFLVLSFVVLVARTFIIKSCGYDESCVVVPCWDRFRGKPVRHVNQVHD